jgi:hypothetical protein
VPATQLLILEYFFTFHYTVPFGETNCLHLYSCRALLSRLKIGIVGGGVQLGPLGTTATNRPIVPAPGDYDDGEIGGMIGRGNRSTRRKPASMPLCPPQTPHAARTRTRAAAVGSQRLTAELRHGLLSRFLLFVRAAL